MIEEIGDVGVASGQLLAGRYRVERILGRGGMGVVVAATDLENGGLVAVKRLLPEISRESESVARFLREVEAGMNLRGPHFATLLDLGQLDDGAPFMVMELLVGRDLGARLGEQGSLSVVEAVEVARQALVALAEAHAAGFVHRDLKPENLFLCERPGAPPHVKVLDFGITKWSKNGTPHRRLTRTNGGLMGSPHYMSPEQIRSPKLVDARSDLWAMGVILYECLAGAPPFDADSVGGLLAAILVEAHVPLRMRKPDLPEALAAVVERCLAKAPDDRFASAEELALALAVAAGGPATTPAVSDASIGSSPTAAHDGAAAAVASRDAFERIGAALPQPAAVAPRAPEPGALGGSSTAVVRRDSQRQVDVAAITVPLWGQAASPAPPPSPRPLLPRAVAVAAGLAIAAGALIVVRARSREASVVAAPRVESAGRIEDTVASAGSVATSSRERIAPGSDEPPPEAPGEAASRPATVPRASGSPTSTPSAPAARRPLPSAPAAATSTPGHRSDPVRSAIGGSRQ